MIVKRGQVGKHKVLNIIEKIILFDGKLILLKLLK